MGKRLGLLTLAMCIICSLAFADDAAPAADQKQTAPKTMAPPQIKMPTIDPKVWDFLPETVAVVGDQKISKEELIKTLEPEVKMLLSMGQQLAPEQYKMLAKNRADELVNATILEQLAAKAGYKVTPEMENEVYKKFTERFKKQLPEGQEVDFPEIIKKQGLDINEVKKQLAKGEAIQEWIKNTIAPEEKVTDEDARKFYNENKERYFKQPETVTASHILIKPKEDTPEGWKEAKAKAEKVYKEVVDGGNFAELAKKYSDGPSAKNGGNLGKFIKGQMAPEFEAACWKLAKDNKINGVDLVKTKFGWHIIKVTAYQPAGYIELDDQVLAQLKEQLQMQKIAEKVKELIEQETAKLKPQVLIKVDAPKAPETAPAQ